MANELSPEEIKALKDAALAAAQRAIEKEKEKENRAKEN